MNDYSSHLALQVNTYVDYSLPQTLDDVEMSPERDNWIKAMEEEMSALHENRTWNLTENPGNKNVIKCKWVFQKKFNSEGNIEKFKARLVAKGFQQRRGIDYDEIFAPVAKLSTIRTVLAIANHKDLFLHQMDVKTAFLNGVLEEEIYMYQPEGYNSVNSGMVCKLNKSLYGLKQSPRCWNKRFNDFMVTSGFERSKNDYCLYSRFEEGLTFYVILYVDDLILCCNDLNKIQNMKNRLCKEFKMTDFGKLKFFLGIEIERDEEKGTLSMSQKQYILKLLDRFQMTDCKGVNTPMEKGLQLEKNISSVVINKPYRELIGCLMYLMLATRPDICYTINFFSKFQNNFTEEHWIHLKRVLRYLKETVDEKLVYQKTKDSNPEIMCFADADWANDVDDRRSISGFVCKIYGSCVSWSTKKQPTVSLSSTEAEFISLCSTVCEALWLKKLVSEIEQITPTVVIFEDNQACISIAKNPREHGRMKHIDTKYLFIRECIENYNLDIKYICSQKQQADLFTKSLSGPLFVYFKNLLGILSTG
uniref:Copia protein n=1 Tax=Cacopsylla melanoneura TaxID=428564 RepID=A0A8D9B1F5_9HEMI